MSITSDRIRELRKSRKVTQRRMAELFDLTEGAYRHYESGKGELSASMISDLANFFDVSVDYLLGRTDNPESRIIVMREGDAAFSDATPEEREMLRGVLEAYRKSQKKK